MMSHITLTCVGLSILLSVVSSRMMVHYPMDLGNYVDYRQDLAGDLLKHRYEMASNLYGENIFPASLGIPHAGFGISHVVRDPLFGGAIINDPLMMGVPQQTVYVQAPPNTVATGQQVVQPTRRVAKQLNTQPQVTWIQLDQQTPLNTAQRLSASKVPKAMESSSMSVGAGGTIQTSAAIKKFHRVATAPTTATNAQTNVAIKNTATKNTASKTIISTKRVPSKMSLKTNIRNKTIVPQTTVASKRTTIHRGVARRQRPQSNIQSKINTLPGNIQGRSFQRGSSTRNRVAVQSPLRLLRTPPKNS